jgi:hypothetical protein
MDRMEADKQARMEVNALERARALGRQGADLDPLELFRAVIGREDQPDDGDLADELCEAFEEGAADAASERQS